MRMKKQQKTVDGDFKTIRMFMLFRKELRELSTNPALFARSLSRGQLLMLKRYINNKYNGKGIQGLLRTQF